MAKQSKKRASEQPKLRAWRPTVEDARLLGDLKQHLGVRSETDVVRAGLRALARQQGLAVSR